MISIGVIFKLIPLPHALGFWKIAKEMKKITDKTFRMTVLNVLVYLPPNENLFHCVISATPGGLIQQTEFAVASRDHHRVTQAGV